MSTSPFLPRCAVASLTLLLLMLFLLTLGGCASIILGSTQSVDITSNPAGARVQVEGDTGAYITPVTLTVPRSGKDLHLVVSNDSLRRDIYLESYLNNHFIFWNMPFYGPGHLVDLLSDKRFGYDEFAHIDLVDSALGYPSLRDGDLDVGGFRFGFTGAISVGLSPQVTWFMIDTGGGVIRDASFFSLVGSVDYCYGRHSFLSLTGGWFRSGGYSECFGDGCDKPRATGFHAALANGHVMRGCWLGYGVQGTQMASTFRPFYPDSTFIRKDLFFGPNVTFGIVVLRNLHLVGSCAWHLLSVQHGFDLQFSYQGGIGLWFKTSGWDGE